MVEIILLALLLFIFLLRAFFRYRFQSSTEDLIKRMNEHLEKTKTDPKDQ